MSTAKIRIKFYLLSLALAFPILAIQTSSWPKNATISSVLASNIFPIIFIALTLNCIYLYWDFKFSRNYAGDLPEKITKCESVDFEAVSFLATYIVPIVFVDYEKVKNFISAMIVLVIIGLIFTRTRLFYSNPVLSVLGFRLYKITTENGEKSIISATKLSEGNLIRTENLGDGIFYTRGCSND